MDSRQIGTLLRDGRLRHRLSQPEAAKRAGVSTRLWSEVERGERPHVSFATLVRMLALVDVSLGRVAGSAQAEHPVRPLSAAEVAALREDIRQAVAYGVDLTRIREGLDLSPLEHAQRNDEALAFFASVTVTPGWRQRLDGPE